MNAVRDPDAILAAWLIDGPTELPRATRHAIAAAIGTADRRRPNRTSVTVLPTGGRERFAMAVVAVMVAVGGAYLLGQPGRPGGVPITSTAPSASTAPMVSAAPSVVARDDATPEPATPPMTWTEPYTSARFGYSIRYPAGWTVVPADPTRPADVDAFLAPDGTPVSDVFPIPHRTQLSISVSDTPPGLLARSSLQDWAIAHFDDPVTTLDSGSWCRFKTFGSVMSIPVTPEGFGSTVIGGRRGVIRSQCARVQAAIAIGDRIFVIVLASRDPMPTGDDGTFAGFAKTIEFPAP